MHTHGRGVASREFFGMLLGHAYSYAARPHACVRACVSACGVCPCFGARVCLCVGVSVYRCIGVGCATHVPGERQGEEESRGEREDGREGEGRGEAR